MNRLALPRVLTESRVVAVMRGLETDNALDVAAASMAGGVSVFEVTMDSPQAERTIESLAARGHVVGAGTILSVADAHMAVESGAQFLVSPHTDDEIIAWAIDRDVPMVPGGYTPTEIFHAWSRGAAAVKLFPASIGGPALVRAILGPLGGIRVMVTGGVDGSNIGDFLEAGAVAAGVGGWLVDSDDLATVSERAEILSVAALASNVYTCDVDVE